MSIFGMLTWGDNEEGDNSLRTWEGNLWKAQLKSCWTNAWIYEVLGEGELLGISIQDSYLK